MTATTDNPTYSLKGFVSFGLLANNTPNQVAPLGELSVQAQTYAKEKDISIFGGSTGTTPASSVDLKAFSSLNADGSVAAVPSDYAATILTMATWIYVQAQAGNFSADPNVFIQAFQAEYQNTIHDVSCDPMVNQGTLWMPGSVTFFFTNPSSVSPSNTTTSRIKLWFSDAAFRNGFDIYEFAFVPPIANLDDFFLNSTTVQQEVDARTMSQTMALIAQAKGNDPYTEVNTSSFNWMDPNAANNFIPTNWTYLIWGEAGNNIDAIKLALQAYILANSTHTHDEWAKIFPDIFTSTEFIITPMWTQYAIPDLTLNPGMYQPTVNPAQGLVIATETAAGSGYTNEWVGNVLNVVPCVYKTLSLLAVGGPQNKGGIVEFAKRWPDYLSVPTTSLDYGRMSQDTQGFVSLLMNMLKVAETMTETSDLPVGFTRMHRTNAVGDAILYLVASYNGVSYLMVAKSWMVAKYGESTNTTDSIQIGYNGTFINGAYQLLSSVPNMNLQFLPLNAAAGPLNWQIVDTTISSASINEQSGLFSGSFPAAGLYTLTLQLTDNQAHTVRRTFTFNFQAPQTGGTGSLVFGAQNLPAGQVGQAYNGSIGIVGGVEPYSLTNQTLPAGMSATINGSTIQITGTPTAASPPGGTSCQLAIQDSTSGTKQTNSILFYITVNA